MKILRYNLCTRVNSGSEESPVWEEILSPVEMGWNEINEEIAKHEAYNGEYSIVDDGIDEITIPTTEERVEALEAAVTMLCMPDIGEV